MNRKQHASLLRNFRTIHRQMGAILFLLFVIVSISGLLLTWKKNSAGLILAKSHQGTSTNFTDWLPIDSLQTLAANAIRAKARKGLSIRLERIDARPEKGMVKFVYAEHFWGVQLDASTGAVLYIERRNHDIIEKIHDGSILDYWLHIDSGVLKLIYSSITGLALLLFTITGFWLWYGPKVMRRKSRNST